MTAHQPQALKYRQIELKTSTMMSRVILTILFGVVSMQAARIDYRNVNYKTDGHPSSDIPGIFHPNLIIDYIIVLILTCGKLYCSQACNHIYATILQILSYICTILNTLHHLLFIYVSVCIIPLMVLLACVCNIVFISIFYVCVCIYHCLMELLFQTKITNRLVFIVQSHKNCDIANSLTNAEDKNEPLVKDSQTNIQCEQEMEGNASCNQYNIQKDFAVNVSFKGISEECVV